MQVEIVAAQVTMVGERRRSYAACGCVLASISHYTATCTLRNRTLRVGEAVVQPHPALPAQQIAPQQGEPVILGLDGGYVVNRRPNEERQLYAGRRRCGEAISTASRESAANEIVAKRMK